MNATQTQTPVVFEQLHGDPGTKRERIGVIHLTETKDFRDASYECAAWHQTVRCEPQEAVLYSNGYYVGYAFEGEVVGSDFSSHFGGVRYGSKVDENVGKSARHTVGTMYAYDLARSIAEGTLGDVEVELDEGYAVAETGRYRDSRDQLRTRWGFFRASLLGAGPKPAVEG